MGVCDMCGAEDSLFKTEIEGSTLTLCRNCAKFGKVIMPIKEKQDIPKKREFQRAPLLSKEEISQEIVENYSEIIKKKRESLDLKQEDFAKKINEKVALIHKIETGHFKPNLVLARKIERFLKVKLVEQVTGSASTPTATESDSFTLGDFIQEK
ncbi:TIGR00270 family protein [Candidatus Woesearchaeota archaeon]|nr:TIGR00270 family protein [Candidatus Woesearchaeota archaeon]